MEQRHSALTTTTRMPSAACQACGKVNDAASGKRGITPKAGDVSVCIGCGQLNQFNADLALLPVDLDAVDLEPADRALVLQLQQRIRAERARLTP